MAERTVGAVQQEFPEELERLLHKIHSSLGEWRATGKKAGNFDGIRQSFDTLQTSAQTAGYPEVSRLSRAVERLMGQYGNGQASDYDSERVLIDLLEEMHDGLTEVPGLTPDAAKDRLRPLIGIVESLLPATGTGTPDSPGPAPNQPEATGPGATDNRKFSYLLDFSGELGSTRSRLGNTVEQMRRDLNTLKYQVNQIRGDLQAMDTERDDGFQARARKVNLQLDALIRVERKLRERVSAFAGTLNQQSHYGERLQAGLIKAGMVREAVTLSRVLLVRVGVWRFAIRATTIERAMRVAVEEIRAVGGDRYVRTDDEPVPVVDLTGTIGKSGPAIDPSRRSLVLIRCGGQTSAFEVDRFEGTAEVAISPPGSQLASIRGITGATVLADGCIVPVFDPAEFSGHPAVRRPVSNALA